MMKLQPPALEKILSKEKIQYLLDAILGGEMSKVYIGVWNRKRDYVAERGIPDRCVACSVKTYNQRCFDSPEMHEWISSFETEEGDWDYRSCKEPAALHYAFKIFGKSQELIGFVIAGPVWDKDSDGWEIHTDIPRLSEPQKGFLVDQCKHLAETISKEYCTAASAKDVWVAMPFSQDFNDTYALCIHPTLKRLGYEPKRVDHSAPKGDVMAVIYDGIRSCAFLLADITGANGNVMCEIGFAKALGKTTLLISRDDSVGLPFSFRTEPYTRYDHQNVRLLRHRIAKLVKTWRRDGSIPLGALPSGLEQMPD